MKKNYPFYSIWDTEDCVDGIGCDTIEEAISTCKDILLNWAIEERSHWASTVPNDEEKDAWNDMIARCCAYVETYDPDTDTSHDVWCPSDDDLSSIGWVEL